MLNREVRVMRLGPDGLAQDERTFDAGACGPVRIEAECGKTTVALMLTPDVARRLGQALVGLASGVWPEDDDR